MYCDKCYCEIQDTQHVLKIGDKTYEFCSDICLFLYLMEFQREIMVEIANTLETERQNSIRQYKELSDKIKLLEEKIRMLESNSIVPLIYNQNDVQTLMVYPDEKENWETPVISCGTVVKTDI